MTTDNAARLARASRAREVMKGISIGRWSAEWQGKMAWGFVRASNLRKLFTVWSNEFDFEKSGQITDGDRAEGWANATFVVEAHTLVPALAADVEALVARVAELEAASTPPEPTEADIEAVAQNMHRTIRTDIQAWEHLGSVARDIRRAMTRAAIAEIDRRRAGK